MICHKCSNLIDDWENYLEEANKIKEKLTILYKEGFLQAKSHQKQS